MPLDILWKLGGLVDELLDVVLPEAAVAVAAAAAVVGGSPWRAYALQSCRVWLIYF